MELTGIRPHSLSFRYSPKFNSLRKCNELPPQLPPRPPRPDDFRAPNNPLVHHKLYQSRLRPPPLRLTHWRRRANRRPIHAPYAQRCRGLGLHLQTIQEGKGHTGGRCSQLQAPSSSGHAGQQAGLRNAWGFRAPEHARRRKYDGAGAYLTPDLKNNVHRNDKL